MKKFFIIILVAIILMSVFSSCYDGSTTTDSQVRKQQDEQLSELNRQVELPDIEKFTEKKLYKYIYELKDKEKNIMHLYTRNDFTGKYVYEGLCNGYGISYSTQFSNPEKPIHYERELNENLIDEPVGNLPQAEPNGLFMPTSSSATWIIRIDEDGKNRVEYYEPCIIVTPIKKPRYLCEPWSLPKDY